MVLKLYGMAGTCYTTVRCVLEELNVPYEVVHVALDEGEQKTPAFKARQPFGKVPYIDDDGFVLYESRAICRYLALKHGGIGRLVPDPKDVVKTALFEQVASVEVSSFEPAASGWVHEKYFKELFGRADKINPGIVEHYRTALENQLEGYEAILSKHKYIAGDEFSLVDIFYLFYGSLLKVGGLDYLESEKHPNVARWWKDISSRPSWVKVQS